MICVLSTRAPEEGGRYRVSQFQNEKYPCFSKHGKSSLILNDLYPNFGVPVGILILKLPYPSFRSEYLEAKFQTGPYPVAELTPSGALVQ